MNLERIIEFSFLGALLLYSFFMMDDKFARKHFGFPLPFDEEWIKQKVENTHFGRQLTPGIIALILIIRILN